MVHLHIWDQPGADGWRVVCQGNGEQTSWNVATIDEAFAVARQALSFACLSGEPERQGVDANGCRPVDQFAEVGDAIAATNKAVEALRFGMNTLEKRDHHMRNWLVALEDRINGMATPKPSSKRRAAKPAKRTLRKLARKPAKRAAKAKA